MKEARKLEFPEDRKITEEQYIDYRKHAINSSIWYLQNYRAHSSRLVRRLKEKGYITEVVMVEFPNGEIEEHNILDECMTALHESSYLNDRAFVEDQMESFARRGFGYSIAKMKLSQKGIPRDELDGYDDIFEDEDQQFESLDKIYAKAQRASKYSKISGFEQQMFVKSKFFQKGFDSDAIDRWAEDRNIWRD